jgi:hypothetical protein
MWGGPPAGGPIRSPSESTIVIVSSAMTPSAAATPSTSLTSWTISSGSARANDCPNSVSTATRGEIRTSIPSLTSVKISSKALLTESVSISVPATIATPKKTASAVDRARSLRALKLRTASESIAWSSG